MTDINKKFKNRVVELKTKRVKIKCGPIRDSLNLYYYWIVKNADWSTANLDNICIRDRVGLHFFEII